MHTALFGNLLLMTDSYKVSHYRQYPIGTERIYSYLEARTGGEFPEVVFFGLQYFLKRYLAGIVVTKENIERAEKFFEAHFGNSTLFNKEGWEHILNEHGGKLPIRIKAAPEGMVIPEGNVLMTVENTCPKCYWLVNYLETLLVQVWYGSTTATISREMKKIIKNALVRSGTPIAENLAFKLHDFGYRGVSSPESAAMGDAAHLVSFLGTDTLAGCVLAMDYYGSAMPGFSIPAAEHSTITSWGQAGETDAYRNMLEQYPKGLVAVVSDSWNIRNAVSNIWGGTLKDQVLARDGVLVIRPDSGDPKIVLPEILNLAGDRFGFTTNEKGYKVLNNKVRMIQGDGIKRTTLAEILNAVMNAGWSADNLAFGSGGGLLQDCNRDTQRFAFKCAEAVVDGKAREVYKQPATDSTKNSKRGRLVLTKDNNGNFVTLPESSGEEDILQEVFKDGELLVDQTFESVRAKAALV